MRLCAAHVDNDGETWKELAAEFKWAFQSCSKSSADLRRSGRKDTHHTVCTV